MKLRKSVFFRRVLLLVLVSVVLVSLISAFLYMYIAKERFIEVRSNELMPIARAISSFIAQTDDPDSLVDSFFFRAMANENTNFVDATVYALDSDGELLLYACGHDYTMPEPYRRGPDNHSSDTVYSLSRDTELITTDAEESENSIDLSLAGEAFGSIVKYGDISTTLSSNAVEYVVIGTPIYDDDSSFDGAVVIVKPIYEFSESLEETNTALIIGALVSCLLMLLPAYIISKRLADPIREIEEVASAMSQGDYSKRANEHQAGEIGELAASINDFAAKSEKLEQTRRDYVANISHELRTPMASIRAMSETLRDGLITDDNKVQRYYDHILRESMRMTRLIDDLLELSRLQSRSVALQISAIDLMPVLSSCALTFEQLALDSGVDFSFECPQQLPVVMSNADRIQQILVILLDNAIKHTPDDGKVVLSAQVEEQLVRISVRDTGDGISPQDIPYVFDRFYKSDKSHSSGGTGLGLSIAKEVLMVLGETITVESQLGEGSVFSFTVHICQ